MSKHKRPATNRGVRVADQIQRILAQAISRELKDPRLGLVTISAVEVTPDYAHAKVHFTVMGSEPAVAAQGLNSAAGFLHNILFKELTVHTIPRLKFIHDDSVLRGRELSTLIDQAAAASASTSANNPANNPATNPAGSAVDDSVPDHK